MPKKLTKNEFIEKSKLKHGDKYDYSEVIYINRNFKINILCEIHGIFSQTASDHYQNGCGCPKCDPTSTLGNEKFNENFDITNEELFNGVKKWWNEPIKHKEYYGDSPKDWYDWNGRLLFVLLTLGTNLLIEGGYKSIVYIMDKYGKPLKNVIKKIKDDDIISEYLKDPDFKIDLSEESGYAGSENSAKQIVYKRLLVILTTEEFRLFDKFIYDSQEVLK